MSDGVVAYMMDIDDDAYFYAIRHIMFKCIKIHDKVSKGIYLIEMIILLRREVPPVFRSFHWLRR